MDETVSQNLSFFFQKKSCFKVCVRRGLVRMPVEARGFRSPGAGIPGSCELPKVGAKN